MFGANQGSSKNVGKPITIVENGVARTLNLMPVLDTVTGKPMQIQGNTIQRNLVPIVPRGGIIPTPVYANFTVKEQIMSQIGKGTSNFHFQSSPQGGPNTSRNSNSACDEIDVGDEFAGSPPELDKIESPHNVEDDEEKEEGGSSDSEFHEIVERKISEEKERFHASHKGKSSSMYLVEVDGHRIEEFEQTELENLIDNGVNIANEPSSSSEDKIAISQSTNQTTIEKSPNVSPKSAENSIEMKKVKKRSMKSPKEGKKTVEQKEKEMKTEYKVHALLEQASKQMDKEDKHQEKKKVTNTEIEEKKTPAKAKQTRKKKTESEDEHSSDGEQSVKNEVESDTEEEVNKDDKKKRRITEIDRLLLMDFGPKEGGTLLELEKAKNGSLSISPRRATLPERRAMMNRRVEYPTPKRTSLRGKKRSPGGAEEWKETDDVKPKEGVSTRRDNKRRLRVEESEEVDNEKKLKVEEPESIETPQAPKETEKKSPKVQTPPPPKKQELSEAPKAVIATPPQKVGNLTTTTTPKQGTENKITPVQSMSARVAPLDNQTPPRSARYIPKGASQNYKTWSVSQFAEWVAHVTLSEAASNIVKTEEMDGNAIDIVPYEDYRTQLGLRYGPFMKLKFALMELRGESGKST